MPAAVLRDFVTLLTLVPQDDPRWGPGGEWEEYAQVWAQVLPLASTSAGTEENTADGVQTRQNYAVTIRFRTDVTAKDRITYRGQLLEILSVVDPDGTRQTLAINAVAYPGVT